MTVPSQTSPTSAGGKPPWHPPEDPRAGAAAAPQAPAHAPAEVELTPVPADAPPPQADGTLITRTPVPAALATTAPGTVVAPAGPGGEPPSGDDGSGGGGGDGQGPRGFAAKVWRGRPEDPRWVRPSFFGLLAVTAVLYLWNLSSSGYANSFYSAAVQAGSESWKAFFFGSLDSSNAITVDKPPAALWPMALAVRVFGLSSWSILVPEALMGVGTVAVLYAAVRRYFTPAAGLIAGLTLAVTPVAALMFRFNNPDALLCLLMVSAVYFVLRALEGGKSKWLVFAGIAFGIAFLTKTLQAFLILPPLAILYAVCAPTKPLKRFGQLGLAGLALVVSGGWWVAIVELWPASSRPYIGGSQTNSFLELTLGYNGLGRITGEETGSVGGGGGATGTGQWGETGLGRLFNDSMGGQISWLLPAAFILLAAGLVLTARAKRTDLQRAAFVAWGGSLLFTFIVFSFMSGIFHEYYNIALAPYIAAVVGMGSTMLWAKRDKTAASAVLAVAVAATAWWAYELLGRATDYLPWLRWTILIAGLAAAAGLLFVGRLNQKLALGVAGAGLAASLAGPVAFTLYTVNEGHTGSIITAGPSTGGGFGGGGGRGGGGGGMGGGFGGQNQQQGQGNQQQGGPGGGMGMPPGGGMGTPPGGGQGGTTGQGQQGQQGQNGQQNQQGGTGGTGGGMGGGGGGIGGLLNGATVGSEMKALLDADADKYTWVAAAIGAQNAASYQLATEDPVMAIGGFNGSDPSPTLAQFKEYVEQGKIHYFISSGTGGGGSESTGTASQITAWVTENYTAKTVDGTTVYDLTTAN